MALPKLMRDIFANDGAGPLFRKDRIPTIGEADVPSIFVKVAKQTFTDAQKKQARTNIGADAIPPGTMMAYGGKSVPDGWLLCNGATISRTTYAKLFAAIGTAWGAGDGRTTFKLPDAGGRVMQGVTDASKVGQYLAAGLPKITGYARLRGNEETYFRWDVSTGGGAFVFSRTESGVPNYSRTDGRSYGVDLIEFDASKSEATYSSSSVQVPAIQTLIIIKV